MTPYSRQAIRLPISPCLKGQWYKAFKRKHDNLLSILEVKLQLVALEALVQYYNSPLRCFTFRDFQIAPTLEEYEHLLGLPLAESPYYFHRGLLEGVQRSYLEEWLHQLQKKEDWRAVMDVYGLLVYKIVLFPHTEDYIDLAVIDVFFSKRDRGENPIMAILANTHHTLSYYCERQGKSLRCCAHLLYLWLTAHLFHNKRKTTCLVKDFKWS
ncbi:hypothetical protein CR513_29223, partial [Mucuna pruriens]